MLQVDFPKVTFTLYYIMLGMYMNGTKRKFTQCDHNPSPSNRLQHPCEGFRVLVLDKDKAKVQYEDIDIFVMKSREKSEKVLVCDNDLRVHRGQHGKRWCPTCRYDAKPDSTI